MKLREAPPTAGLPLAWRDFLPRAASLEQDLAAFLQLPEVQLACSGTAALVIALATLKRASQRRSVVMPAYTCPLVALAARQCGLKPVLCDTRPDHFDLSQEALAQVCDKDTLAVIPTHLGGRVADVAVAREIAGSVGALVLEDAAQSLGARWQGRPVGSLGDIGFYSLGVGKGLTIYGGGALFAQDAALRRQLRATAADMAPSRSLHEIRRVLELAGYAALYRPSGLGIAYGMPLRRRLRNNRLVEAVGDDYPAHIPLHRVGAWRQRIGANALRRLPAFLRQTEAQAAHRKPRLAAIPGITVMDDAPGAAGTWPFFMVTMPTQQTRDRALARLWPAGLGVGRLFIHALPDYRYLAGAFDDTAAPNARDFAARMLTITNSPWLGEKDFLAVCKVLEEHAG